PRKQPPPEVATANMAAATTSRRRKLVGQRRRVEDEAEDDGGPDPLDLEDDSMTEGALSDEHPRDAGDDSDTSNIDEASPTSPNARKAAGNGAAKTSGGARPSGQGRRARSKQPDGDGRSADRAVTDTEMMLHGLSIADSSAPVQEMNFDDVPG